jgi:tetratricopeptide (TPR) repeat protein
MRRTDLLVALGVVWLAAGPARADQDHDARKALALLDQVATAPAGDARIAAAAELAQLAPHVRATIVTFLARPRTHTIEDRRAVLVAIGASVPDDKGRFVTPTREAEKVIRATEDLDWLAELAKGELVPLANPAVGEVMADVAAIRALAATRHIDATKAILDVGFADDTMLYRDECGRQIRAMHPYSIPGLIRAADDGPGPSRKRYAHYQLERLDRQEPSKALNAAAGDEDLEVAVLAAFRDTRYREAVNAVLDKVDDDAPRVRAMAREAWMAYISGPPPPEAPKKKLQLPGGKVADKETPLWFTYRELADQLLRRKAEELFGEEIKPWKRLDLKAFTKRMFAYYDDLRAKRDEVLFAEARTKRDAGDLAGAIVLFDQLLVQNADRPEKAEMAAAYLAHGKALGDAGKWGDAAAAYSKAHGLDPEGAQATHALASQHFALGKALEADGKDGGSQFRKAAELEPTNEVVQEAAVPGSTGGGGTWMLILGGLAAAGAAVFLGVGLVRRRSTSRA